MAPPNRPSRRSRRRAARSKSWRRRKRTKARPRNICVIAATPRQFAALEQWTYRSRAPNNVRRLPMLLSGGSGERAAGESQDMVSAAEQLAANLNFGALAKAD